MLERTNSGLNYLHVEVHRLLKGNGRILHGVVHVGVHLQLQVAILLPLSPLQACVVVSAVERALERVLVVHSVGHSQMKSFGTEVELGLSCPFLVVGILPLQVEGLEVRPVVVLKIHAYGRRVLVVDGERSFH